MIIRPSRLWIATTIIEFDCRLKLKKKFDIWHIPKEEKETKFNKLCKQKMGFGV